MIQKLLLTFLAAIFISFNIFSQYQPGTISGSLKSEDKVALTAATIALCRAKDSVVLSSTQTDASSGFLFHSISTGQYLIKITSTLLETYYTKPFILDSLKRAIKLQPIILVTKKPVTLDKVVVTGKRPLLEHQIDRMVVNVDAMISAPGSNALEILEKTPGVSVELSGSISLNGKNNVLIMIDGRPTNLSASDLTAYLRSLPGGTLDKIELIDNPPARYEAAGNAIINIKLKRNKLQGFTGSVTAGFSQGKYFRSNDVLNLNFNRKKFSLNTSVGYNRDAGFVKNSGGRIYYSEDGNIESELKSDNFSRFKSDAITGRVAIDYAANKKTSYGAILNFNSRYSEDHQLYENRQSDDKPLYDSLSLGITDINSRWRGGGANLNFLHKFNGQGRELSADLNYLRYTNRGNQYLTNTVHDADNAIIYEDEFSYYLPSALDIYSGQVDYVHPLANKARIDAGFKTSQVTNDNELSFMGVPPVAGLPDLDKSNHFIYKETISAIYLNTRKDWRRFGFQAGLRVEYTGSDGDQLGNQQVARSSFRRDYLNAFPSFFMTYKLDTTNTGFIDLSYSRRIRRPNYQMLNPFEIFVDNYSYTSGNPMLTPQLANQLEIKYRYKKYFGIGFQQGFYTDVIFQITESNDKIFVTRPQNVAKGMISSLNFNGMIPFANWWNLNVSGNIYRAKLTGNTSDGKLEQEAFSLRGSILNQFTLGSGWNAELNGYYNGKDINGQRSYEPRYRINAGIQKKILKGKGSLRLSFEDIFYTWKAQEVNHGLRNAISYNTNQSDTRRLAIGFTYSFGKDNNSKKRSLNENSASEEKSRVD
ncbi:outer membrane beta-barrel protein [Flavitalea sp.]|nr:TonB-dependent receptor [Flavitalea sp.]